MKFSANPWLLTYSSASIFSLSHAFFSFQHLVLPGSPLYPSFWLLSTFCQSFAVILALVILSYAVTSFSNSTSHLRLSSRLSKSSSPSNSEYDASDSQLKSVSDAWSMSMLVTSLHEKSLSVSSTS